MRGAAARAPGSRPAAGPETSGKLRAGPRSPAPSNPRWHALSTRISSPGEAHERAADQLAQRFLAARSPRDQALPTPAEFGRFAGLDLSRVRIHHDPGTHAWAHELGTRAFTIGDDIGLARGRVSAATLAHELAHVASQRTSPSSRATVWRDPPKDDEERRKQQASAGKPPPTTAPAPFVHPYVGLGLPGEAFNRTMTSRYPELKLSGDEWYGAWVLGWSLLNPLWQPAPVQGGDATPGEWKQDYTRFSKYVSALQKLTPGKGDPYLDVASLATGTRIEDYLSHDRFSKAALKNYWWQLLLHYLAVQGVYSGAMAAKEPGAAGTLETSPGFRHLGLPIGLANLAAKKYLTLGSSPLGVGVPIGSDVGLPMSGPLSPGLPGGGLTLDYQTGVGEPGSKIDFALPFNLARTIFPDEPGKPKSRLELGAWGSYGKTEPTPSMQKLGVPPMQAWSVGANAGYDWGGALHYRSLQSGGFAMHQFDAGAGYLPREPKTTLKAGPVSFPRFGVNLGYAGWSGAAGSAYAPRLGGGDAGSAWRLSPFLDLGFDLGKGYQLGVGGQPSATFRGGTDPQRYLDGLRLMIALQHLRPGAPETDKKRLELSYSQNRYEWLDPKSPMMHAIQAKGQWGPWFAGAQVNWMQPGLEALRGGPYAPDFATSADPLRDLSILFLAGYRFGAPKYPWGFHPKP